MEDVSSPVAAAGSGDEIGPPKPGSTVLDRVHQAMILFGAGRAEALKTFLVEDGGGQRRPVLEARPIAVRPLPDGHRREAVGRRRARPQEGAGVLMRDPQPHRPLASPLFRILENDRSGTPLKEAALAGKLGDWTPHLTGCRRRGVRGDRLAGGGQGSPRRCPAVARKEYLVARRDGLPGVGGPLAVPGRRLRVGEQQGRRRGRLLALEGALRPRLRCGSCSPTAATWARGRNWSVGCTDS